MHASKSALLITGAILASVSVLAGSAWTQNAPPSPRVQAPVSPAVQNASAKPIGKVVTATGAVNIEHVGAVVVQVALGNQASAARVGDLIYLGDVVQTGTDGKVGITFTDGTAFNLSSNARMAMTEFVYDPNSKSNSTLLSLTKGTFTFVAGKIASTGDMKIDTPVATMGIRGTTPHVEISDDGTVKFTTLIEEGKNQVLEKSGAVAVKRQGGGSSDLILKKDSTKPNLEICRGC